MTATPWWATAPYHTFRRASRLALAAALAAGTGLVACGEPTGPSDVQLISLQVAAHTAPCVGVGPMTCLLVRERADQPWQLFYDGIEGFTHEEGFAYTLLLARRSIPNPPADGSSLAYRLVALLAREPG
jgi:hypothetical protein